MEQSYAKPLEAYRAAFAPVLRAQQEGLKAFGRFARFQYTIASDLLEHNLAGVRAAVSATTPVEYLAAQGQLNIRFLQKVATHTREFVDETADGSIPAVVASTDVASEEAIEQVEQSGLEQSDIARHELQANDVESSDIEEEGNVAAYVGDDGESLDDQPSLEAIEGQPIASSKPNSTKARQGKRRADKSRRGQAHH